MREKQSFIAKILEKYFNLNKSSEMYSTKKALEFLDKKSKQTQKNINSLEKFGDESEKRIIVYIHGGAFVNDLNLQHTLYCRLLSKKLDAYVIAPRYPLAPNNTYQETFKLLLDLYKNLLKTNKEIIIIGDSAGGGIAISFCQYLNELNLLQPTHLITFSPWVDLTMNGNYPNQDLDPILGVEGLKVFGKSWAGNSNLHDYKLSPIYGDFTNIASHLTFVGTHEIFYSDIQKIKNAKIIVGKNLNHVYPLFPIPEARDAFKIIKKEVME